MKKATLLVAGMFILTLGLQACAQEEKSAPVGETAISEQGKSEIEKNGGSPKPRAGELGPGV